MMTRLQLALDGNLEQSLRVLEQVQTLVDIIEIGTPLIYREGMPGVRAIRSAYPKHSLLADLKIMDAGGEEATIAFEAGADIVSVLGLAHDTTVRGAVRTAAQFGRQVLIDMMGVTDMIGRTRALMNMGVQYICVHTGYDQRGLATPLQHLRLLRQSFGENMPLAVAGGINLRTIDAVAQLRPAIVIVGSAITQAEHPAAICQALSERLKNDVSLL